VLTSSTATPSNSAAHGPRAAFAALARSWRYEGGRRDLRLDLLRGFAAFAMIADHIGGEDSWLYALTGGNRFFVSAAEAFVFISGVVMGIVYLSVLQRQGLAAALVKAFHRAWTLYLVTVFLTLSFAATGYVLDLWWAPDTSDGGVERFVVDVATLHRTLFLTDVMLMYTLLLLAAGPVIVFLSQRRPVLVLAASWAIWGLWQVAPESSVLPWQIQDNTVFLFPAWQVLFVTGIVIGWHREAIAAWFAGVPRPLIVAGLGLVTATVVVLYLLQLTNLDWLQASKTLNELVFTKADVPVGRLVVFAFLAAFSFTMTTVIWTPLRRATGWLLLPLGQNALTAYSLHIFVVALTTKLWLTLLEDFQGSEAVNTLVQIGGLGAVWLVVVLEPGVKTWLGARFGVPIARALHRAKAGGLAA
jgi:hypothetical protein